MSTSISPLQHIVALVRQQLAGAAATPAPPARARGAVPQRRSAPRPDLAALARRRVRGIDRSDPECGRKAVRMFLELLLLQEFGEHLINDSAFQTMVDQVQARIEQHPPFARLLDEAGRCLLEDQARRA